MKDAIHHLKHVQKKVIQSLRKKSSQFYGEGVDNKVQEEPNIGRKPLKIPNKVRI